MCIRDSLFTAFNNQTVDHLATAMVSDALPQDHPFHPRNALRAGPATNDRTSGIAQDLTFVRHYDRTYPDTPYDASDKRSKEKFKKFRQARKLLTYFQGYFATLEGTEHLVTGDPRTEGTAWYAVLGDEAGMWPEALTYVALQHALCDDAFVVLVGDHFQLPPWVATPHGKACGLDVSVFELSLIHI